MTINKENYSFRKELAADLLVFKKSLEALGITANMIDRAVRELKNEAYLPVCEALPSSPLNWGYKVDPLTININDYTGIQYPKSKNIRRLKVTLDVNIIGEFSKPTETVLDPYKHLEFNLIVEGYNAREKHHILSFHLDRHIDGGDTPEEAHPIYHFQVGGRVMQRVTDKNFGNSLILDSPRLMHHPMDFMLGIDFVLSNFSPKLWRRARKDQAYVRLILKSQKMAILPFVKSLSQHFKLIERTNSCWEAVAILPQLVN